jgi:hypothetical protein
MLKLIASLLFLISCFVMTVAQERPRVSSPAEVKVEFEYRLLATNRVTTMENEIREAASAGYRFAEVISGATFWGGGEALVVMARPRDGDHKAKFDYKLLATSKTSTMQKELQEAGDAGYEHRGQSVFQKRIGTEVVVILERELDVKPKLWEYKLLATKKTSTMQKELMEAAEAGYQFVGFSTGPTLFGGNEVVTIMRRPRE